MMLIFGIVSCLLNLTFSLLNSQMISIKDRIYLPNEHNSLILAAKIRNIPVKPIISEEILKFKIN